MPGYHRVPGAYGVSGSLKFQDSDAMQRAHDILRANGVSSQVLKALEKQRADEMQTTLELMKAVAGSKAVNLGGGFKPRSFGISSLPVPAPSVEPLPVRQPRSLSSRRIVRAYAGESLKRFVRY